VHSEGRSGEYATLCYGAGLTNTPAEAREGVTTTEAAVGIVLPRELCWTVVFLLGLQEVAGKVRTVVGISLSHLGSQEGSVSVGIAS